MKIKRIMAAIMAAITMTVGAGSVVSAAEVETNPVQPCGEATFYATKWYDSENYYIRTDSKTDAYFWRVYTTNNIYVIGDAAYQWDVQPNDSMSTTYTMYFTMLNGSNPGADYYITYNRPNGYLQLSRKYYR